MAAEARGGVVYATEGGWCDGADHAALYEKFRREPPPAVLDFIVEYMRRTRPAPNGLALDAGCGTGQATRPLAKYFDKVIGVDVSQAQVEAARNVANTPANVSYQKTMPEEYPVGPQSCDLVIAVSACHWFNMESFYAEAKRILSPGGTVALVGYTLPVIELPSDPTLTDRLTKCCVDRLYHKIKSYWREEIQHVNNEYQDFELPFAEPLYLKSAEAPAEFINTIRTNPAGMRGYFTTWSGFRAYLAHCEPGTGDKELQALSEDLAVIAGCSRQEFEEKEVHLKMTYFLRLGRNL